MAKLKLGTLIGDKPIKLTLEIPAALHRDLFASTDYLNSQLSQLPLSGE